MIVDRYNHKTLDFRTTALNFMYIIFRRTIFYFKFLDGRVLDFFKNVGQANFNNLNVLKKKLL